MGGEPATTVTQAAAAMPGSGRPSLWELLRERLSLGNYVPVLRQDLTRVSLKTRHGEPYVMLAERGRTYLHLSEEDDYLASQMDGTRRVCDLVVDYFHRFGRFGFERIGELVADLRQAAFLRDPPRDIFADLKARLHPTPAPTKPGLTEGSLLMLRFPLRGIDGAVTRLHDRIGWIFFKRPVLYLTVAVTLLGLAAFVNELRRGRDPFAPIGHSHIGGLAVLVVAFYAAIFVHESAHALTCKHFGRRVDKGGFMLFYFVPAFYVDVTDAWLEPWRRRIAVSWAGPYSGFILAGATSILVWFFPNMGLATAILFKLAFAAYINNAFNLMPLLELDGYYILMDWLEIPQLRQQALAFIKGPIWHLLLDREPFSRRELLFAVFGTLSAIYSFLSIYLAFLYWGRRLKPIVQPLWQTPGLIFKVIAASVVAIIVVPLGIRFGQRLREYQKTLRRVPGTARKVVETVRIRERQRLLEGLAFLETLPRPGIERLARAARVREVAAGTNVVRQGERGDEFFVIAEGEAAVLVRQMGDDRTMVRLARGDFFGERALLGSGVRTATVRAETRLKLLVFDHRTFWKELGGTVGWTARVRAALDERERLQALPLFAEATSRQLDLLAVKLEVRSFGKGDVLVRQGDTGDAFFIVREGSAEVIAEENGVRRHLAVLQTGDFFGEVALLHDIPRTATVQGKDAGSVWRLERRDFHELLGRYLELEGEIARVAASRVAGGHSMAGAA